MKKISLMILLAVSTLSFQACDNNKKESDSMENAEEANENKEDAGRGQSEDTNEFAMKAANGGMMEVEMGRWRRKKA